jgi:hypothetical protein
MADLLLMALERPYQLPPWLESHAASGSQSASRALLPTIIPTWP